MQCVQVALLCVQERAADKPTMSDVVYMLESEMTTPQILKNFIFLPLQVQMAMNCQKIQDPPLLIINVTVSNIQG
jgi:hypothetical protein